jgi:hypothetical protein
VWPEDELSSSPVFKTLNKQKVAKKIKIVNNDIQLFEGDEISIMMIYNNLTGANFESKEAHQKYLSRMKQVSGIHAGDLSVKDKRNNIIKQSKI